MKRKKVIILIVAIVALVFIGGMHLLYLNERYGSELYQGVNTMSGCSYDFADGIDHLEDEFEAAANDSDDEVNRSLFDHTLAAMRIMLEYDEWPFTEEVRLEYKARMEELYTQTYSDEDLAYVFTDAEEFEKIINLRNQLETLTFACIDFREKYNQIPSWKRYFISWREERRLFSEQASLILNGKAE